MQNNPKSDLSPLLRPTKASPPETRPARGLVLLRARGCAAPARAVRGCALLRAAVRGRVVARGRELRPLAPAGGAAGRERELEWEGGEDLGFWEEKSFFFTERREISLSVLNVRVRALLNKSPFTFSY